jgi:predicted nucleic acid-binding protein
MQNQRTSHSSGWLTATADFNRSTYYEIHTAMDAEPKNISWSVPHYLDTSVVVKLVVPEDASALLRDYLIGNWSYHFHITEFAFYETLSVLKRKLEKKEINQETYLKAVVQLASYLEEHLLEIDADFRLDNFKVIYEVSELVKMYSLDYSDALQIYTVLNGKWSGKRFECTVVFVTTDSVLDKAARLEGLRVWNPLKEANPPS